MSDTSSLHGVKMARFTIGDDDKAATMSPLSKFKKEAMKYHKTFSAASKSIQRTITQSGLKMPKRIWMQTVPNQDVDVVITFSPECSETTVLWFKERIEKIPGIILKVKSMTLARGTETKPNCFGFLISATYQGYLQGLEQLQVPKPVKFEFGGGSKEFTIKESSLFRGIENLSDFLTSQERQAIIYHLLTSLRAEKGDKVGDKVAFLEGEAIVPLSLSNRLIFQVFPVHESALLDNLKQNWVKKFVEHQPIGAICEYFGVKIAMYFAWLGHYTTALSIPAVVGIFFWFFFCGQSQFMEDLGFVMFAFFNVIWATLYLESWKRRSAELAYEWGTGDQRAELLSEPRPLFKGVERISEITGKPERVYPEWRRNVFRYFVTVPVISVCLAGVFMVVFLTLELQQWWDRVIASQKLLSFLSYMPKIFLGCVIPVLDDMYRKIAIWLNDMENYRSSSQYENNAVIKIALFQFVNSFLALFYTAFYLQDMEKLKELLAAILITRQVMGNIKESLFPYIKQQLRFAKISIDLYGPGTPNEETENSTISTESSKKNDGDDCNDDSSEQDLERKLSQVEMESSRPAYEGTFDDYLEMFIQFGYVILFSSAYPLAGFFALLNNLIEIRGDAFKLCHIHRRPFGQRVNSIGTWQTAMEMMGVVAVIVNCALIGLSGQVNRILPDMTNTQTILLIIVLEHLMLGLKVLIAYAIPDIPSWVATEMAKIEYNRREIEKASSLALIHSSGPSAANSIETVDRSVQTEEIIQPKHIPFEDETLSLTIDHNQPESTRYSLERNHRLLEKMNSLSSISSVDTERFKATIENNFAKNNLEKGHKESPQNFTQRNSTSNLPILEDDSVLRKRSLPEKYSFSEKGSSEHIKTPQNTERPTQSTFKALKDGQMKVLYQRMMSDSDLWGGVRPKYKRTLNSTQELSPVEDEKSTSFQDTDSTDSKKVEKKSIDPDTVKRVSAKKLMFKSGRSSSLASFISRPSKKNKLILENQNVSKPSNKDEKYLQEYRPQGELEILGLESLINLNDVRHRMSK